MGCSADNLNRLPDVFGGEHGPVLSRIGQTGLQEIPEIDFNDVDRFIIDIINYVRDESFNLQARIQEVKSITDETADNIFFPFTVESIEALKSNLRGIMTPREITQRMTQAAGKAFLLKKPAITRDAIS